MGNILKKKSSKNNNQLKCERDSFSYRVSGYQKSGRNCGHSFNKCGHNSQTLKFVDTEVTNDLRAGTLSLDNDSNYLSLPFESKKSQSDGSTAAPVVCLSDSYLSQNTNIEVNLENLLILELTNRLPKLSIKGEKEDKKDPKPSTVLNLKKSIAVESIGEPIADKPISKPNADKRIGKPIANNGYNKPLPNEGYDESVSKSACEYCGVHNPKCVIQCKVCNKWFCNSRPNISKSHAVQHLISAKHKQVGLHKNGLLGNRALECSNCGCDDVFVLGLIAKNDSEIVFLCRQPCAGQRRVKDIDIQKWEPLIKERKCFISLLVKRPSRKEQQSARKINFKEIDKSKELCRDVIIEPPIEDLNELEVEPKEVVLRFKDEKQYRIKFESLVKMEDEYSKTSKEKIEIRWDSIGYNKIIAFFEMPKTDPESDPDECNTNSVSRGDKLRLIHMGRYRWSGFGHVIKIPDECDQEVGIEMHIKKVPMNKGSDTQLTTNFIMEHLWESVSSDRILNALQKFERNKSSVSQYIRSKLLGHEVKDVLINSSLIPKELSAPNLPKLNKSQEYAVKHSVQRQVSLIQGPPGTGKTATSAAIVYNLANLRTNKTPILVCAQSNIAVDQLTEKIHKTCLKVVRVCAKTKEEEKTSVSFLALHNLILNIISSAQLKELERLKKMVVLSNEDEIYLKELKELKEMAQMEVLGEAAVICCTCIGAGDKLLSGFRFASILIDESMQATEPECMVPIVLGTNQLILVGDQKQLGPVVMCKEAESAGLSQSLFQRLFSLGINPLCLQTQYRMHPSLSEFPSKVFYEGSLQDGVCSEQRIMRGMNFRWPQPNKPMFFYLCDGQEERAVDGTSFLNRKEASLIEKITTHFMKLGIKPNQMGVITPYGGQRLHLAYMKNRGIEVASVNAFQGREKDFIIMSCVRSNNRRTIGFLKDPRRLNVAITRARYGLIIVGNPKTLSRNKLWYDLLSFYKDNKVIVEGPLNNLKESRIIFSK